MQQRIIKFRAWEIRPENSYMRYEDDLKKITNPANLIEKTEKGFGRILMQYTGLKDKNGKEIYEGDIFKSTKSDAVGQVKIGHYDDVSSSQHDIVGVYFEVIGSAPFGFKKAVLTKKNAEIVIEVIGNIHENPELLK